MPRPSEGKHGHHHHGHRRPGRVGALLRILLVIVAAGIVVIYRPLGDLIPAAPTLTSHSLTADSIINDEGRGQERETAPRRDANGSGSDDGAAAAAAAAREAARARAEEADSERTLHPEDEDLDGGDGGGVHGGGHSGGTDDDAATHTLSGSIDDDDPDTAAEDEAYAREQRARAAADAAAAAAAAAAAQAAAADVEGPFFTCPDGRVGLHVVHVPLLLDQTPERGAAGVFLAGRTLLFRDFTLPSLARQTARGFVVYVSYDPNQDQPFVKAARDALRAQLRPGKGGPAPGLLHLADNPRYFANKPDKMLAFPRVANLLVENGVAARKDTKAVTLYVTSRLAADDAVHVDAVKLTQEAACGAVGPEEGDRVLATRLGPKLAWFPHANTTYGVLAAAAAAGGGGSEEAAAAAAAMAAKPHLASLAVDVSLMLCAAPLTCYTGGGGGGGAAALAEAAAADDCPFSFDHARNVRELRPDGAVAAALYARPPLVGAAAAVPAGRNFSIHDLPLGGFEAVAFDLRAITDCGIAPGELSATNLLLASVYAEAPYFAGLAAADADGWGAVGGLVRPPAEGDEEGGAMVEGDGLDEDAPGRGDGGGGGGGGGGAEESGGGAEESGDGDYEE